MLREGFPCTLLMFCNSTCAERYVRVRRLLLVARARLRSRDPLARAACHASTRPTRSPRSLAPRSTNAHETNVLWPCACGTHAGPALRPTFALLSDQFAGRLRWHIGDARAFTCHSDNQTGACGACMRLRDFASEHSCATLNLLSRGRVHVLDALSAGRQSSEKLSKLHRWSDVGRGLTEFCLAVGQPQFTRVCTGGPRAQ